MRSLGMKQLWWLATLLTPAATITPLGVLQSYPELSTFYGLISASANATAILGGANNFTLLAPTNDAIEELGGGGGSNTSSLAREDLLLATLQYSLLRGIYPALSFSNVSQFVATNLDNATYANVTGGQTVELLMGGDGTPEILSGNKSISRSSSTVVCTGGIVHIVDAVPSIPIPTVLEITAANLQYFISILTVGNFLDASNADYVNGILEVPDVTYFIPNSAVALANATALVRNSTTEESRAVFEYHIVPGRVAYSTALADGSEFRTAQGDALTIHVRGNETFVNAARVTATDYIVANGVVHVLDDLLNRFDKSGPPPLSPSSTTPSTPSPSPTSTSNGAQSTTPSPAPATSKSSSSLSKSAKIGIGIGVPIFAIALLSLLAFFLIRSRRRRASSSPEHDSGIWDDHHSSGLPEGGKFYVRKGTVHRQDAGGGGGMREREMEEEEEERRRFGMTGTGMTTTVTAGGGPDIPPRSPSRALRGNEF